MTAEKVRSEMGTIQVRAFCPHCRCELLAEAPPEGEVRFYQPDSQPGPPRRLTHCPDCGADLRGVTREELITKRNWP